MEIPRFILSKSRDIYRFLLENRQLANLLGSIVVSISACHAGDRAQFPAGEKKVIFYVFNPSAHQFCHDDSLAQMENKQGWNKEVSHKNVGWTVDSQYTEGHCIISWRTELEWRKSRLRCLQAYSNTSKQFKQDNFSRLAEKLAIEHIFSRTRRLFHFDHYGVEGKTKEVQWTVLVCWLSCQGREFEPHMDHVGTQIDFYCKYYFALSFTFQGDPMQ